MLQTKHCYISKHWFPGQPPAQLTSLISQFNIGCVGVILSPHLMVCDTLALLSSRTTDKITMNCNQFVTVATSLTTRPMFVSKLINTLLCKIRDTFAVFQSPDIFYISKPGFSHRCADVIWREASGSRKRKLKESASRKHRALILRFWRWGMY